MSDAQIIKTIQKVLPAVVSVVVGKAYEEILKENPYELVMPHGDHFDPPVPEDELPHIKGGKVRVGGGSGFFIEKTGLIVTNKHVVRDKNAEYLIACSDEQTYPAHIVAQDPLNDVAVLQVEHKDSFPCLTLGNSDGIKLGQSVIAVGTALGEFQNTVSTGIISGLSRFITAVTDLEGHTERLRGLIQTDAAINPGNSGGPLVNLKGEVIAINTAVAFGAQNIGFAIPINKAKRDILDLREHGRIRRPFLGIRYISINPMLQKKFRLPKNIGALVLREGVPGRPAVMENSPAARAGIREGDIILSLKNTLLDEKTGIEDVLDTLEIGEEIPVKIFRDGKEEECLVRAEERV